jgi:membrane protein YqaA with SNARE-associated domain
VQVLVPVLPSHFSYVVWRGHRKVWAGRELGYMLWQEWQMPSAHTWKISCGVWALLLVWLPEIPLIKQTKTKWVESGDGSQMFQD